MCDPKAAEAVTPEPRHASTLQEQTETTSEWSTPTSPCKLDAMQKNMVGVSNEPTIATIVIRACLGVDQSFPCRPHLLRHSRSLLLQVVPCHCRSTPRG